MATENEISRDVFRDETISPEKETIGQKSRLKIAAEIQAIKKFGVLRS